MQIENLINWRQLSKVLSKNGNETAVRKNSYAKWYDKAIEDLLVSLQQWKSEHIDNNPPQIKLTVEEIKNKLNTIEW